MVEYIVAIDVTRVRFPADAFSLALAFGAHVGVGFHLLASLGSFYASTSHGLLANFDGHSLTAASIAQLVEHALRKRMVRDSIPLGGCLFLFCDRTHMALSSAKLQPPSCMVAGQAKDVGESGLFWELNPGSLAPSARIIPPDQAATCKAVIANSISGMHTL